MRREDWAALEPIINLNDFLRDCSRRGGGCLVAACCCVDAFQLRAKTCAEREDPRDLAILRDLVNFRPGHEVQGRGAEGSRLLRWEAGPDLPLRSIVSIFEGRSRF